MADLPNTPETRREQFLNAIATGDTSGLPEPVTREEVYLDYIAENGGGGSEGVTPEQVRNIIAEQTDDALSNTSENPVQNKVINAALVNKVDVETGKGLSSNDFTTTEKNKLADLENYDDTEIKNDISDIKGFIGYSDTDIFGVEVDMENRLFTRLAGAVGKTGGTDFDSVPCFGGRKRCNLTDDGVVTAYFGNAAYTETGALSEAVTVGSTTYPVGTAVQVMVEQPKFYYKVVPLKLTTFTTQDGETGYSMKKGRYYVSSVPKEGFKLHPAFIRNGVKVDKIYLSAYEGCIYDTSESVYILDDAQIADFNSDKFSSIANAKPASGLSQNLTRANTRKLAQNRGTGWEQSYIHTVSASQLLMLIEYGTFNMQTAIGAGIVNKASGSGNESELTGYTTLLGNSSGTASTSTANNDAVSYRGEENPYGNIQKWLDGCNEKNPATFPAAGVRGTLYIADHSFGDDTTENPYQDTGIHPNYTSGSYINAFGYSEDFDFLFVPCEVGGDSNLPVGDYFSNNSANWHAGLWGGVWSQGARAGAFYLDFDYTASRHASAFGGRLVYVPISA